ncbi:hypothetical protein NQ317_008122 [Molorchus minor]|uniref:Tetraspanin n=1 Tax=Molorchus minor TaxID=1323400 RepID=A0ABQ9IXY6_9CUCU|nr:hypothetical protein NQ317_008122 [Molorchus minor]
MVSLKCKELFCLVYSALLFVSGVILITLSVLLSYKIFYHFNFIPSETIGPFILIFILGFLHLFLTWLGIKGPTREHNFHIILCCGLNGSKDYSKKDATPISCTDPEMSNATIKYVFETGCRTHLIAYARRIMLDGAMMGFISGLFQALGIFAFYTFFKSLRHERSERITRRAAIQRQQSGTELQMPNTPHQGTPPTVTFPPPPTTPPTSISP